MFRLPDSFFLTGTDTGVGKTHAAVQIVRERRAGGLDCVGMKPICCGGREDAEMLHEASGREIALSEVNPLWLRTPAAPYVAAMAEGRPMDMRTILDVFVRLRSAHAQIVVEGVGGWRVPITRSFAVSDLAFEMGLPVVVVVANRLGALNHAVLTVEAVQARGLACAGVILNEIAFATEEPDVAVTTNPSVLEELLNVPILRLVPHAGL